ncbi:MAG: ComEC/Rec2 family competence protein, partial [Oscillospiraceae bacterium]|nr:ComEC/Rec2 family competence protein [Oscillospiraceae bacterium]
MLCQYVLHGKWRILLAFAAVLISALPWRHRRIIRIGAAGLAAGVIWFTVCAAVFLTPMETLAGSEEEVCVELLDYAEETDSGVRCKVKAVTPVRWGTAMYYGSDVLLYLEPGDRVRAAVKYYSAASLAGEESTYFTSQGIYYRLYASWEQPVASGNADSWRYLPQRLAKQLRDTAAEIYPQNVSGFLTALLTGERDGLDLRTSNDLSEAGLMHITAVSGLHCGFLITVLGLLVLNRQKPALLLGYPVLLLYMVMVGCTPSVVRSCIMVGFVLLAPLLNRESDPLTSLSGALLVILLANPFAAASVSLQMSFAAAAGLLLFSPKIYAALQEYRPRFAWIPRRVWGFFLRTISGSFAVMILTAPLNALYFGSLSLVSPLANLLVLWMMSCLFS